MDPIENPQDRKERLLSYLRLGQNGDPIYREKCKILMICYK